MTNEMRALAEQFCNPFAVSLGIIGSTRIGALSVPRTIGHDQLPAFAPEDLLRMEIGVASG
jgi:hypothetical protein